jgi:peptidoglycan/LPS O-acetylase OafA/YrhL
VLLLLLVASTVYDVLMWKFQQEPNKLFIAFSAYTHGRALYDITENKSPSAINCLNGLRGLSVFWIMFGHRIMNQSQIPMVNREDFKDLFDTVPSVIVSAYHLAVDTFFLMGGLLMTQSMLRAFESKKFNYFRVVYRRYIRYTPVYAAIILYTVSLMKFTRQGPFQIDLTSACEKYWWSALLHVQNYVNPLDQCLPFSWYLGADFQLFVISPFLIYPAVKYGWKYLWSIPLLGFMSAIYMLVFSLVNDLYVRGRVPGEPLIDKWLYYPTHARMGPWMIGITLGYILHQNRNKKIQISKTLNSTLWIVSLSMLATVMLTTYPVSKQNNNETSQVSNAIYAGFHRFVWATAVGWIIFACHVLKTGGIIKWFLELRQFQPICRMGLSLYLIHPIYQLTTFFRFKQVLFFDVGLMVSFLLNFLIQLKFKHLQFHFFWGDIVVAIVLATFLYLTLENPILLIDDCFHKMLQSSTKRESS